MSTGLEIIREVVERELGPDWIPVTKGLVDISKGNGEEYGTTDRERRESIRSLLPIVKHPLITSVIRKIKEEGGVVTLDGLYRVCLTLGDEGERIIRETLQAQQLWERFDLNPRLILSPFHTQEASIKR